MSKTVHHHIDLREDEPLFVLITQRGLPPISLDLLSPHGRRGLSIRVNGMSIASVLIDVKELPPRSKELYRFCPFCGEGLNMIASVDRHKCSNSGK